MFSAPSPARLRVPVRKLKKKSAELALGDPAARRLGDLTAAEPAYARALPQRSRRRGYGVPMAPQMIP